MGAALFLTAWLAGAAPAPESIKLAAVGFSSLGMTPEAASFYGEHFASRLAAVKGFDVTTPKDMAAALGIEKQKELLGCSDAASNCMAELAGALGVDGIITGQIAKVGKTYQVTVKVLAASGSRRLFVRSSKLLATEEDVIAELNDSAEAAAAAIIEQLRPPATASTAAGRSWVRLTPAVVGVVLAAVGVGFWADAGSKYGLLSSPSVWPSLNRTSGEALRADGIRGQLVGIALVTLGAVALIGGVVWWLLSGGSS